MCQNFHSLATLEARFKACLEACFTDKNFSRERLSCAWEQNRPTACSAGMHDRARLLLSAVTRRNGLAILENPSTSMTQHMLALCEFGTNWAKTWCFVTSLTSSCGQALLSWTQGSRIYCGCPTGWWNVHVTPHCRVPTSLSPSIGWGDRPIYYKPGHGGQAERVERLVASYTHMAMCNLQI